METIETPRQLTVEEIIPLLKLKAGEVTIIAGANGAGKSGLLDELARYYGDTAERFSGHRQITFNDDEPDQLGQSWETLKHNMRGHVEANSRFRNSFGEAHLKSVILRLLNTSAQRNHDLIKMMKTGGDLNLAVQKFPSILEQLNGILVAGRLAVQLTLANQKLKALRDGREISVTRLSDGERSAILLGAAVLIQPANSYLLIDEPERHLNPRISGPLISAAVRARSDVSMILATHDVHLIDWLRPNRVIHVINSTVISLTGAAVPFGHQIAEQRTYVIRVLENADGISDDLRYSLLGSRKAVLLVEGEITSEDIALYGILYPEWTVTPRGGWDIVDRDVRALQDNRVHTWLNVAGIIDGDGRSVAEKEALADKNVFCLPVPTVECLFFLKEVMKILVEAAANFISPPTAPDRLATLESNIPRMIAEERDDLVHRRLLWQANRQINASKISLSQLKSGARDIPAVNLRVLEAQIRQEIAMVEMADDPLSKIHRLPIKSTKLPSQAAQYLGFTGFRDYKKAVLTRLQGGNVNRERLLTAFRSSTPAIALSP